MKKLKVPLRCSSCTFRLERTFQPVKPGDVCPWCGRGVLKPVPVAAPAKEE